MAGMAPRLPLYIDEIDGAYALIDDFTDLVEQNLKMLLFTIPGEKIMNPDYGVGLRQYLFENSGMFEVVQSKIKARIHTQTKAYLPYIDINVIEIIPLSDEANGLRIYLNYDIVPLNVNRELDITQKIDSNF